jgi:hypothetical protein
MIMGMPVVMSAASVGTTFRLEGLKAFRHLSA